MKRYLKLYKYTFKLALIKTMAYPQDFLVWSAIDILWSVVNLGFFKILLLRLPNISGWTFEQITIPLGMVHLLNAFIWGAMYGNMKETSRDINKGNLDLYLVKPADSQFLLSTRYVSFNLLPTFLIGLFLIWYGLSVNHIASWIKIIQVPIGVIAATVISYSIWFITITTTLWFNRLNNIAELFPHSLDVARYPVQIFPPLFRFIFTFIIPFAIMGYLPAEIILGRTSIVYLLGPITASLIFLILSHKFWLFALHRYSSASS